ncbi:tyrosine-protein phosphatase [Lapidilactobacillus wuchangensis]|uniref:tyrosine-protein phosphatase n=1 Tax=Lapidilactobacillus wuchangensis TaxID=2486001 RepID=UPI000F76D97D|nr:tyrosine-protein phosphatase [Lapidilactobacillus wuchangensis]
MRVLELNHTYNVRDLGGTVVSASQELAYHKLIRSANLVHLDQADSQFLKDYGVQTVIDLRAPDEVARDADQLLTDGIEVINIPIFQQGDTDAAHHGTGKPISGYEQMLTEYTELVNSKFSQQAYQQIFAILLANKQPGHSVLFHCWGGKDRTGIIAYLLLGALGVAPERIFADYMYTNVLSSQVTEQALQEAKARNASQAELADVDAFMTAKSAYYERMDHLINRYGGTKEYLKAIVGLNDNDFISLRQLYIK